MGDTRVWFVCGARQERVPLGKLRDIFWRKYSSNFLTWRSLMETHISRNSWNKISNPVGLNRGVSTFLSPRIPTIIIPHPTGILMLKHKYYCSHGSCYLAKWIAHINLRRGLFVLKAKGLLLLFKNHLHFSKKPFFLKMSDKYWFINIRHYLFTPFYGDAPYSPLPHVVIHHSMELNQWSVCTWLWPCKCCHSPAKMSITITFPFWYHLFLVNNCLIFSFILCPYPGSLFVCFPIFFFLLSSLLTYFPHWSQVMLFKKANQR